MATIALYAEKIYQMPDLLTDAKNAVTEYKNTLFSIKKKVLSVDSTICNLDNVISDIQASTQLQEDKEESLEALQKNFKNFVEDIVRIDYDVADLIRQRKEEFYNKYSYLRPESDRSWLDKAGEWLKSAGEWCRENWDTICNIALAIIVIAAIVAISIATFPAQLVFMAAIVGAIVGAGGQFVGDCVASIAAGKPCFSNRQTYVGAFVGGAVGGVLMLTGNAFIASAGDAMVSTFLAQNIENISGGEQRSSEEIWFNTGLSGVLAGVSSKIFGKATKSISQRLAHKLPQLSRLSGRGSYEASFKMIITKLKNGQIKHYSWKTLRNGIVSGLQGDLLEKMISGIWNARKEWSMFRFQ
jgi:hypothetical protein